MNLRRRVSGGESVRGPAGPRPGRRVRWPLAILAFLLLTMLGIHLAGLRLNFSSSLPPGLYRTTDPALRRGSVVLLCVPEPWATLAQERGYLARGSCPAGTEPLGKRVAALPGDWAEVTEEGLRVNGKLLRETAPLRIDSRGRRMPALSPLRFSLRRREILVFTSHPRSFDSRYFGAIPREAVIATIEPVWIWEGELRSSISRSQGRSLDDRSSRPRRGSAEEAHGDTFGLR